MSAHESTVVPVAGKKRIVTSCIACYLSKQKCDRRQPCENCRRRRRPERCVYQQQPAALAHLVNTSRIQRGVYGNGAEIGDHHRFSQHSPSHANAFGLTPAGSSLGPNTFHSRSSSLIELFGYSEDNEANTAALLKRLNLDEKQQRVETDEDAPWPREIETEIRLLLKRMPHPQVLDILMQFFMSEINWMDQLVHPHNFWLMYERWWATKPPKSVEDLEFAALFMRMSSYASQFMPSPAYTIEHVRGVPLADIRTICSHVGDKLAAICAVLDSKGSLVRVQHLLFAGLQSRCEGRVDTFWDLLNSAIRVAQRVGMHRASEVSIETDVNDLQNETRRRTFCNLFIWDSLLARQLDRIPFLPDNVSEEQLPRLSSSPESGGPSAPESFTERLLQFRLAAFWRTCTAAGSTNYNALVAEERYEKFCAEFILTLPPAFALDPSTKWDTAVPALSLQRQRLLITILDSVCWNFRPVLRLQCSHVAGLSPYKRVLIASQRRALVAASLKILEAVVTLHNLLGACHTRFVDVVFYTFEAAVLVLFLCTEPSYLEYHDRANIKPASGDPLRLHATDISREHCLRATRDAAKRLRMLAEVSDMAAAGSRALEQLLDRWEEGLTMADFGTDPGTYQDMSIFGVQMQGLNGEYFANSASENGLPPVVSEDVILNWTPDSGEFDFDFEHV